jgi:hypothetical protein
MPPCNLQEQIEKMRSQLTDLAIERNDLKHPSVVLLSQALDELIISFQKTS